MRIITIGAGAIGGLLAGRLYEYGHESLAVARGEHADVLSRDGLTLADPERTQRISLPVVRTLDEVLWRDDDVVFLAVKSQDSLAIIRQLAALAPSTIAVVCAQNGLENERVALRYFRDVYAMCVMTPATHLAPGVVRVHCGPKSGVMDLGRWPSGTDERSSELAAMLEASNFDSATRDDIATLKWAKLLGNIHNSIEALVSDSDNAGDLRRRVNEEAANVLAALHIDVEACQREIRQRHRLVHYIATDGENRGGGSSWQSLARGAGDIETDFLNGEIVLHGRLTGVATPVNERLQRRADAAARARQAPRSVTVRELLDGL